MKNNVTVSFGFDTEAPRGNFTSTSEGQQLLINQLRILMELRDLFNFYGVKKTHFLLGQWVKERVKDTGRKRLRELLGPDDISDVQTHTYSHPAIKPIKHMPDRIPMKPEDFFVI